MPIIKKKTNPASTYTVVFPLLYLYCFSLSSVAFLARTRIACVATTTNATARNTKNKPYQYIRRRPAEPRKHQASAAQCHHHPFMNGAYEGVDEEISSAVFCFNRDAWLCASPNILVTTNTNSCLFRFLFIRSSGHEFMRYLLIGVTSLPFALPNR